MSSLTARMKKIKLKMKVLDCSQDFSHYKSMGIFPDAQGQLTLQSLGPIWSNFELVQGFMVVLLTCKNEKIRSQIEALECSQHYTSIFQICKGSGVGVVSGRNLKSSKLSYKSSLPARMRLIKSKMKELECSQDFSHFKSMGIFPDAQGQLTLQSLGPIWSNFELVQGFMVVLLTCKNEEDPITNRGSRVFTTLYINFSDMQGLWCWCGIWPKFELIQAFIQVLLTCKNEVDQIKNEGARVFTRFHPF